MIGVLTKMRPREFYLVLAGATVLVIAGLVSVLVVPPMKGLKSAREASATLPPVPADAASLQSLLVERDAAIVARARELHGDMASLPVREIEAFVIDRLQGLAWANNVILEGVAPSTGDSVESFREVLFQLEVSGRYADLYAWLRGLRSELGFIVIKEYRMARADDSDSDPQLAVEMTIASYRKESS